MSALSIVRQRPAPEDLQMLKSILERICLDDMHSAGLELTRMAEAMINAPWLHQTSFDLNALLEMGETLMREAQALTQAPVRDRTGH